MFVFPMAGLSSRFAKAGYDRPKYMLPAGDRNLLEHSISGFSHYFDQSPFLFIHLANAVDPAFIRDSCRRMGLPDRNVAIVALSRYTGGQAETVAQGLRDVQAGQDQPITIFNIDTMYRTFRQPDVALGDDAVDGYLDVMRAEGDHWSFVRPEDARADAGRVLEVTEKVRISELCSTGLYHFRAAGRFLDAFDAVRDVPLDQMQGGERYIAPLYNQIIAAGGDVAYPVIPSTDVRFSGTPNEYVAFVANLPFAYE